MITLGKFDRAKAIAKMEELAWDYLLSRNPQAIGPVTEHFSKMRMDPSTMGLQFKFETVPELGITRLVLEAHFKQVTDVKHETN